MPAYANLFNSTASLWLINLGLPAGADLYPEYGAVVDPIGARGLPAYKANGVTFSSMQAMVDAGAAVFTRASPALAQKADGTFQTFTSGKVAETDLGVLLEEARTNLFLNSAAPVTQTIALSAGTYTQTAWGTSGSVTSAAGTAIGSGFGATASSTFGTGRQVVITTGGTVTFTVSGSPQYAQVELGSSSSSPIATTGTAATRAATSLHIPNLTFAGSPITVATDVQLFNWDGSLRYCSVLSDVANNLFRTFRFTDNSAFVQALNAGVANFNVNTAGKSGARVMKTAVSHGGSYSGSIDSVATGASGAAAPIGPLTRLDVGQAQGGGANWVNGYVRRILIKQQASTQAELNGLTT